MRKPVQKKIADTTNQLKRLLWVLDFVQRSPETKDDEVALAEFLGVGRIGQEETEKIRLQLARILMSWVRTGGCKIDRIPATLYLKHDRAGTVLLANPFDDSDIGLALLIIVFLLMAEGHRVRRCHAPARYGKPGEECGRLFAGRLNQTYCGHLCTMRAGTHRARNKQSTEKGES